MSEDIVMQIASETLKTMVLIAGPMLIAAMVIGIIVSVLQAITQINEATLTFIPKMVAIILVLVILAPWMMEVLQNYSSEIFGNFSEWVR
ncbi:MAG: flagellar biosynthesis protein FliQ [Bdellovibrionales bacterium]|nr:flagellar biosynthesis protein FliQ [Bdellovibrionales bacterium]